jgi:hypothetical protein
MERLADWRSNAWPARGVTTHQHWQHKRGGFAGSGLCDAQHVPPAECRGQRLRLDSCGALKSAQHDVY